MVNPIIIFISIFLIMVLAGVIIFKVAKWLLLRNKNVYDQLFIEKKNALLVWRILLFLLILYAGFLSVANKSTLTAIFEGYSVVVYMTIFIFTLALIEMLIIDCLLPHVVDMWKRIVIELGAYITLVGITLILFSISLKLLAGV